jgi:hypothetical protein
LEKPASTAGAGAGATVVDAGSSFLPHPIIASAVASAITKGNFIVGSSIF